jgi:hypothetical protein
LGVSALLRDFTKKFSRKLADGNTTDHPLAELRASGASITECIFAVRSFRRCDLVEAKTVVHHSSAWADMREHQDRFHEELERGAQKISGENA